MTGTCSVCYYLLIQFSEKNSNIHCNHSLLCKTTWQIREKKCRSNENEMFRKTILELEGKESEHFKNFIKQQQERDERLRKLEEEREREREDNERFDKQMGIMVEMQMAMLSAIMGAGPSTSSTAANDPGHQMIQLQQFSNTLNGDNQFQGI